jgi:hypothetical protein
MRRSNTIHFIFGLLYIFIVSNSFAQKNNYTIYNELIVLLDRAQDPELLVNNQDINVTTISESMNIFLFTFNNDENAKIFYDKNSSNTAFKAIQYNHRFEYRGYTPIDSYYTNQWYMNNTGQYGYTTGVDIDAQLAWDSSTTNITRYGDTIVVAVADTKFDLNHSDMSYFKNYDEIPLNGIDDDANGYIDDFNGWNALLNNDDVNQSNGAHATQVAGIIGAKHNNKGIAGICNGVKILPIYTQAVESQAIEAYAYIVDMRKLYNLTSGTKGAYIVASNSSFGINDAMASDFPIWCAMYDSMGKYGILSVAATANRNQDVDIVGDMPTTCKSNFLVSVTNTTGLNQHNISSAYGNTSIDLGAPGTNILSCIGPEGYAASSGTSFSSPMIAGAVAFLMSYACPKFLDLYDNYPDSAVSLLKKYILDGTSAVPELVGKSVTGGKLNLYNALLEMNNQFDCTECNGSISASSQNVLCNSDSSGSVNVTISPANISLTYNWSNGANTNTINNLQAGTYRVTITDSVGCTRIKTYTITEPNELLFDSLKVQHVNGSTSGNIYVTGVGGSAPITYSIDGTTYVSTNLFLGLGIGSYTVYIKDGNGCIISQSVVVENHTGIFTSKENSNIQLLNNASNTEIYFSIETNYSSLINFEIFDIQGKKLLSNHKPFIVSQNLNEKIDISNLSNGIYLLSFNDEKSLLKTFKIVKY